METATRSSTRHRRLFLVCLAAALAGVSWLMLSATRGESAPLRGLEQLNCKAGSLRSTAHPLYADGPAVGETPETIAARYLASPGGTLRKLDHRTVAYQLDHTVRTKAKHAVVTVASPLGSPSTVIEMYKADNGDWRIETIANCEPKP